MTAKFYAILTNQGAAMLANAAALGTKLNLTQMAVGDANGALPVPDPAQTKLINQKRIAPLNMLSIDPQNASQIVAEQVIPENEGGFWIREIGLFDDGGVLIAVANCPETYKPQLQEGSGRTQTIRMALIVSSTAAVTLKIDPSVVLATRQYVDEKVIEVKAYADDLMKKHVAAENPHTQYLQSKNNLSEVADKAKARGSLGLGSAALKNTGTSGDAVPLANGANTWSAKQTFSGGAEGALTGNASTATKLQTARKIGGVAFDGTADISVESLLHSLRLSSGAPAIGIPFYWPSAAMPNTVVSEWADMIFLKWNGASFSASEYPLLAQIIPSLKLTDVRGEFIRVWDDGRGVDNDRSLLSAQGDAIRNITGNIGFRANGLFTKADGVFLRGPVANNGWVTSQSNAPEGPDDYMSYAILDASSQVPTANENRPRNITFNFLVRAK